MYNKMIRLTSLHQCLPRLALLFLLLVVLSSCDARRFRKDFHPSARKFTVVNLSLSVVEVYWMNFATEERVLQFQLLPGAKDHLNSHVIHEFEVREKPNKQGTCPNGKHGKCRKRHFQISAEEDQVFTITPDFQMQVTNSLTRAKQKARETVQACRDLSNSMVLSDISSAWDTLNILANCMTQNVQATILATQEEIDFQSDLRLEMGFKLQQHACQDPKFPGTFPLDVVEWNPENPRLRVDDESHTTRVLLQADTTMVATIENMARPLDCEFVQSVAVYNTQSQMLEVPWEARKEPQALAFLSRIFAYIDPALKLMDLRAGMPPKGEPLFYMYHDSGQAPPEQRRHQAPTTATDDGDDDWPTNSDHLARLYLFCQAPDNNDIVKGGGAIHFPESGVHVYPQRGDAILVTHTRTPSWQGLNDKLSNEHIDCPVWNGTRIMLQHQLSLYPRVSDDT